MKALFLLAMAPITAVWYGFVLTVMWGWFVVPTFKVDPLRIPFAIGLAYIVTWLTHPTRQPEHEPETMYLLYMALFKPLLLLFVGWIVTWFI